jgi:hypothetical protein
MKWYFAALIGLGLLEAWLSPAVGFEGRTDKVGGGGGAEFDDRCKPDQAVVGLSFQAGKDLNAVAKSCLPVEEGGTNGGYALGFWGHYADNGHGSAQGDIMCPEGMVVQAIHATMSRVHVVHDFWLRCRNVHTGKHTNTDWSVTQGGEGGTPGIADCGNDGYALGIWGGYGALVDAIGLVCVNYRPPAAPPPPLPADNPPQPSPQPKPDKPAHKIDNGENADIGKPQGIIDNGNEGKGGGDSAAATDTTIYDQPQGNDLAYLSAGDPVTVVSCSGDNWCQISKPRKGWVWGDDLNH